MLSIFYTVALYFSYAIGLIFASFNFAQGMSRVTAEKLMHKSKPHYRLFKPRKKNL